MFSLLVLFKFYFFFFHLLQAIVWCLEYKDYTLGHLVNVQLQDLYKTDYLLSRTLSNYWIWFTITRYRKISLILWSCFIVSLEIIIFIFSISTSIIMFHLNAIQSTLSVYQVVQDINWQHHYCLYLTSYYYYHYIIMYCVPTTLLYVPHQECFTSI